MAHRPLWLLAAGMGNEIPALGRMAVKVNVIYAVEHVHERVTVLQTQVARAGVAHVPRGDECAVAYRGGVGGCERRADQGAAGGLLY